MTTLYLAMPDDPRPVSCANCDWKGIASQTESIDHAQERMEPGEIVPAGECPVCGALAYLENPINEKIRCLQGIVNELLEDEHLGRDESIMSIYPDYDGPVAEGLKDSLDNCGIGLKLIAEELRSLVVKLT